MTLSEMIYYGTTKADQLAVVRSLAGLTKGTQVTVNSLLPGPTVSKDVEEFLEKLASKNKNREEAKHEFFRDAQSSSLLQRFITVDKIASTATYLVNPLAATTGASVHADGGLLRQIQAVIGVVSRFSVVSFGVSVHHQVVLSR